MLILFMEYVVAVEICLGVSRHWSGRNARCRGNAADFDDDEGGGLVNIFFFQITKPKQKKVG